MIDAHRRFVSTLLGVGLISLGASGSLGAGTFDAAISEPEAPIARQAGGREAPQPVASPTLPSEWLGVWRGDVRVTAAGQPRAQNVDAPAFTMELRIAPIASGSGSDRFTWTIIYEGSAGKQERPYELIASEPKAGRFQIDEKNGIVLDATLLGSSIYSQFLIMGSRIAASYRLEDAGTADASDDAIVFELISTSDEAGRPTGGQGQTPPVTTWPAQSLQRATLRRVESIQAGSSPARSSNAASPAEPPSAPTADVNALPGWTKLNTEAYRGKQDDVFFVTPRIGWYVNGAGKIFKTTDAGETWTLQLHKPGTYFRCIAFLDEQRGFAGNIGPGYFPNVTDDVPLYQTLDGGATWTPVTTIEGPAIVGLCAMEVVREEFINAGNLQTRTRIVGVGRVGGPSVLIFSDDLGATWKQIDLTPHGAMAFDVHFFDFNHGVVASATTTDVTQSRALILTTSDAGKTWTKAFESTRPYELTWKIAFPTRDIGYVTIQSYNPDPAASQRFVAKTTDAGKTWSEIPLVDDHKVRQFGVAFVDAQRGWIGAMPHGFQTVDGGATWSRTNFGNAVNKIRVLRDGDDVHAFAIGVDVSKTKLETK
ncbi:MAG: hypothetical protein SFZ23_09215 [Planctomycetota bacterium]|nr:hypothetical protein [Planctomycetota bacterium]